MDTKQLEALIREAVGDADLRPEEIPAIDLYLDQITSLAADKRKAGSPRFYDRELTKTMVNNYSKDGLIRPIKGKKYSKEHILQMLLVYEMKNTLSIGEIRRVLQSVYAAPDYDATTLLRTYDRYLAIKEMERAETAALVEGYLERSGLNLANEEDFLVALLGLSNFSSYLKNVVQTLLEAHYPEKPEKDKAEKAEKPKKQKKEKTDAPADAKEKDAKEKDAKKAAKSEKKAKKAKEAASPAAEEASTASETAADTSLLSDKEAL